MDKKLSTDNRLTAPAFLNQAGIEVIRAERYRTFLSMVCMDLGAVASHVNGNGSKVLEEIQATIRSGVRASDQFALMDSQCVAILLPETSRQDAEVTARRLTDSVKETITRLSGNGFNHVISIEMASFPDTGGARTVTELLLELESKSN